MLFNKVAVNVEIAMCYDGGANFMDGREKCDYFNFH